MVGAQLSKVKPGGRGAKRAGGAPKKASGSSTTRGAKPAAGSKGTPRGITRSGAKKVRSTTTTRPTRSGRNTRSKTRKGSAPAMPPVRTVAIRQLDPQRKCGPGTSVQHLFRVDEQRDGRHAGTHLVFFDRHGWYCEHGRSCPAVDDVRKSQKHMGRLDKDG